ncbi:MAG: thioredoxin family protein [Cytophagales bacterium]|nr:thioredoxin family protein [Cytophagales bacterium]
MKNLFAWVLAIGFIITGSQVSAQKKKIYDPHKNGIKQLSEAVTLAKAGKQHVLVMVGGNWCSWCLRFDKFVKFNHELDSIIEKDYELVHLNYSPENKNYEALEKLGFPQRFGFPVFVVLDGNGKRLHTQNSAYLESGRSYDKEKVKQFLLHWRPEALKPENYKK